MLVPSCCESSPIYSLSEETELRSGTEHSTSCPQVSLSMYESMFTRYKASRTRAVDEHSPPLGLRK
eukprot:scaffold2063_cov401-Prasinococcus_capsulatus_cf.AAC.17